MSNLSLAEYSSLHPEALEAFTEEEKKELLYSYSFWARPKQLEPEDYFTWLILSGRGFGKSWVGSQWTIKKAKDNPNCHIGLIGESAADIRDVMVENGTSSILKLSSPNFFPLYEPSKRRLTWPNGSRATLYSADKPDLLRGPQHHFLWMDELAKYHNPYDVYDMAMFGLRLGDHPQQIITTTPKPLQLLKDIIKSADTYLTTGSTYENRSNLPDIFFKRLKEKYEGTTLGQQEIEGILLDEAEGALWSRAQIEQTRLDSEKDYDRIVIGVDVAITSTDSSDETGIIVCASKDNQGYVLKDSSGKVSPSEMANRVIDLYWELGADAVVLEVNQGGDYLKETIRLVERERKETLPVNIRPVWAAKSKKIRAGVIYPLYEQNRIHHIGILAKLEDQMCTWVPGEGNSPDRLDALVWALTELFIKDHETTIYENTFW